MINYLYIGKTSFRMAHLRQLERIKKYIKNEKVVYCDSDSIFTLQEDTERKEEENE